MSLDHDRIMTSLEEEELLELTLHSCTCSGVAV